jgi:hypothetical protein
MHVVIVVYRGPICLSFQRTFSTKKHYFFHNKLVNNTFQLVFLKAYMQHAAEQQARIWPSANGSTAPGPQNSRASYCCTFMALPLPSAWTGQHPAAGLQPRKIGHTVHSCMLKWWRTWTQVWLLSSILGSVPGDDRQTYSRVTDSEHCAEMTIAELPTSHPWHYRRYQVFR